MKRIFGFVVCAAMWIGLLHAQEVGAAPEGKPNVLMIMVDDMGFSDIGCYGGEARTPHIDALAQNGIRFRQFHNTGRCSPSRASILTGTYSQQVSTDPNETLPTLRTDNNITLPELLREQGYRTYMAGKWHLGAGEGYLPWDRGFQHVYGLGKTGAGNRTDYWEADQHRLISDEIAPRTYGSEPYAYHQTDAIGDACIDFIDHHRKQKDGAPFFLYVTPRAPHFWLQAPMSMVTNAPPGEMTYLEIYSQGWNQVRAQRFERMRRLGVVDARYGLSPATDVLNNRTPIDVPDWDTLPKDRQADLALRMSLYTAMIEQVDGMVGRIVDHLKEQGALENTLIFFLSDNGSTSEGGIFGKSKWGRDALTGERLKHMGQPGQSDHIALGGGWANVGNTPLRLFKRYQHEGGISTPLVVHWPAGLKHPGRWSDQTGHIMDLYATVADVLGIESPAEYRGLAVVSPEGQSLAPVFRDHPLFPRQIAFEHESNRAYIDGPWKLAMKRFDSVDGRIKANEPELYNLERDPSELINVAGQYPERLAAMIAAWNAWADRVGLAKENRFD